MASARPVRPGSLVDAIAPAGPFDREAFLRGVAVLESQGLRVRYRPDIFDRSRFWAGTDERRAEELQQALAAPDSDLLWCGRGGYGTTRILETIDVELVRRARKILVGFSDITALHGLWLRAGVPSIHSSMIARLPNEPGDVRERLFDLVLSGQAPALFGQPLLEGSAEGELSGGNVAVLAAVCGTPFQPDFSGKIVFLEDIGEKPYRLDRLLVQCRQAGLFRGVVGLAIGEFTDCEGPAEQGTSAQVLEEHARAIGVPTVRAIPAGHGVVNQALPFGVRARVEGDTGLLTFLEPLYSLPGVA